VRRAAAILLWVVVPMLAQAGPGEPNDTLFAQTSPNVVSELRVWESGPDFELCWAPFQAPKKPSAYLIFLRLKADSSWSYFYFAYDTCFVHYGASLFYPDITYEVHAYFGSIRKLPNYPWNPQEPRLPGDAFRRYWRRSRFPSR
jgi:hypothetical protein